MSEPSLQVRHSVRHVEESSAARSGKAIWDNHEQTRRKPADLSRSGWHRMALRPASSPGFGGLDWSAVSDLRDDTKDRYKRWLAKFGVGRGRPRHVPGRYPIKIANVRFSGMPSRSRRLGGNFPDAVGVATAELRLQRHGQVLVRGIGNDVAGATEECPLAMCPRSLVRCASRFR
jgi:hypothetical protein